MTQPASTDIPDLPELLQGGPLALCSMADIAGVLGLPDNSALSTAQVARIPYLLAKLCSLFRIEAGREFSPGTSTVRVLTLNGRVPLPDPLGDTGSVDAVITESGYLLDPTLDYTVVNNDILINRQTLIGSQSPGTGTPFEITYTHTGEVPWDVRAAMASAVARYLTIDPNSAVAQSTFLSAEGYHQRIATWVADVVKLAPEDIELARAHRRVRVNLIVHKMSDSYGPHTDWSEWQWGGVTIW
jgi:hypothetical protein